MTDQLRAWNFLKIVLFQPPAEERSEALLELASGRTECWHRIVTLANAHFVTPALWLALRDTPALSSAPKPVRDYLETIYRANRARNTELVRQLDEMIHALNGCGIVPTLLKGAGYLKTRVYRDVGVRFLADLDVLVHPDEVQETWDVLGSLRYVPGKMGAADAEAHHHLRPLYREGAPGAVEIHREAVNARAARLFTARDVLARADEHAEDGIRYQTLAPSDMVTASFLHAEVSDRHLRSFLLGLRPMLDLAALHARYGRRVRWSTIQARLASAGLGGLFRKYLLAAWRITGIRPLPRTRFRMGDHAHYRLSELRMRRPGFGRWLARLARLSAPEVQRRYGEADGWVVLTRFRLRQGYEMARRWVHGRPDIS